MKKIRFSILPAMAIGALMLSSCVSADVDLGETLGNAGLNTLMGMGTVFIVLILISFVISLFKLIGKAEEKKKAKTSQPVKAEEEAPSLPEAEPEELVDDKELVAVIAAAIAAYEQTSPDGLIVRSIRRTSGKNQWKRG